MGRQAIAVKLTYVVSHPIQYQAPLLRKIAADPEIALRVLFERVDPDHTYFDQGFQRDVRWDVPLTDGYDFARLGDVDVKAEISGADVMWLHGWQTPVMRQILRHAYATGKPLLMRGENCDMAMPDGTGPKRWLKRRYIGGILSRCTAFLAIGSLNRAYYTARGIGTENIFSVPYAVDNRYFAAAAAAARPNRGNLRAALGIADDRPVVLFAGKFLRRKRADLLAHACRRMSSPPAVVFVGDGEGREAIKKLAPDAVFPGFVNQGDLPAYYDLADVFVLPSEKEPWGLAVNEAMACGTAVVVSDQVGCAPDLVDSQVGAVFPSGEIDALAGTLTHCIANAAVMGKQAQAKISSWDFDADLGGLRAAINHVRGRP